MNHISGKKSVYPHCLISVRSEGNLCGSETSRKPAGSHPRQVPTPGVMNVPDLIRFKVTPGAFFIRRKKLKPMEVESYPSMVIPPR